MALVEMDAQVSGLGGEPQGVPMAGELDCAGAEERSLVFLQRAGKRIATERNRSIYRRGGIHELSGETGWRGAAADRRLLPRGRRRQRHRARLWPHPGRRAASLLLPPLRLSSVDALGESGA